MNSVSTSLKCLQIKKKMQKVFSSKHSYFKYKLANIHENLFNYQHNKKSTIFVQNNSILLIEMMTKCFAIKLITFAPIAEKNKKYKTQFPVNKIR